MNQHLDLIDSQIAAKHLLTHPFYLAWTRGELSREALTDYTRQYLSSRRGVPDLYLGGACALRRSSDEKRAALELDRRGSRYAESS